MSPAAIGLCICNHLLSLKTLHPKIQPARFLFPVLFPQTTFIWREAEVASLWVKKKKNPSWNKASVGVGDLWSSSWDGSRRDLKQGRQWRSKGDDATVVCPAANFKKKMKSFKYVPEQWFFFYIFFCIENKRGLCSPNGNCFFSILNLHFCVKRLWIVTFFLSLRISKERCPKSTNNACYFALR